MPDPHVIPARRGHAVRLSNGSEIEIINPSGTQVVDLWGSSRPYSPSTGLTSLEMATDTFG